MEQLGISHDLNYDLTFYAHTINCVCHSIRSMFRVLGVYNFGASQKKQIEMHMMQSVAGNCHFQNIFILSFLTYMFPFELCM